MVAMENTACDQIINWILEVVQLSLLDYTLNKQRPTLRNRKPLTLFYSVFNQETAFDVDCLSQYFTLLWHLVAGQIMSQDCFNFVFSTGIPG